jgi:Rhodopirellula transposase DDE domain
VSPEELIRTKFDALKGSMDERITRLWAGAEAEAIGYGGLAAVSRATGLALNTVKKGRNELRDGAKADDLVNVRRKGAGGRNHDELHPELLPALKRLVDPATRGDPESGLRWSAKSAVALSREIFEAHAIRVSDKTVGKLLHRLGYSLQAAKKTVEGAQHPDRNAQFEHINAQAESCIERGVPFISVDTKKKERVGNFKNAGVEWQPKGEPELVDVHDFPSDAVGKAIPYGIYDVADNSGFVNVGTDHDTPVFAVTSIEAWWKRMGQKRYPDASELFITADAGGSNGYRARVWKFELQRLADKLGLPIHVSHFPPGTSKWNKVEHRLFSFITMNWRGKPLRTYETVVSLIGNTTNSGGLVVKATIDRRRYPIGKKITPQQMRALKIERHDFQGDWNYTIHPRPIAP